VAILNPDHLFEQAEKLVAAQVGRPRQADIRRAISAAYYGIFHAVITKAVDQFVGVTNRDESRYGLAYRSIDHRWLRELCDEVQKPTLRSKFSPTRRYWALVWKLERCRDGCGFAREAARGRLRSNDPDEQIRCGSRNCNS